MKDFSKENIIDKWLKENGNPEIEKQVENEYKEIIGKQKTPLAQVIKRLDKIKKNLTNKSQVSYLQNIIDDIKSLLPTERKAFENVYLDGCLENIDVTKPIEYGAYFDSKFNQ